MLHRQVAEDEELRYCEAYRRFHGLVRSLRGLWQPGFPLLNEGAKVFRALAQDHPWFPHLVAHGLEPFMYLPQAWLGVLHSWLPLDTVGGCLDFLEKHGFDGLIALSLVVIQLASPALMVLTEHTELSAAMTHLGRHLTASAGELVMGANRLLPQVVELRSRAAELPECTCHLERAGPFVLNERDREIISFRMGGTHDR